MELNKNYFMPAEDFAARHELTTELVIEMIRDKELDGKLSNDHWFVDLTSRRTQQYVSRSQRPSETTSVTFEPITVELTSIIKTIGIISIIFGAFAGIGLLVIFSRPVVSFLSFEKGGGLTFGEFAIAFGAMLFFCAHGVLCLGVSKLLDKKTDTAEY